MAINDTKVRLNYIDWVKAIGIFLIVIGHCLPAYTMPRTLIYSFHVPLFAFAGGLLATAPKSAKDLGRRTLKLLTRMGIPYLIWYVVSCIPYMVEECPFKTDYSFVECVERFFLLGGRPNWNAALWFIPCYFIVNLLFLCFAYLMRGNKLCMLGVGLASFVGIIILEETDTTVNFLQYENIFSMHNVFLLLGYFCIAYVLKDAIKFIATRTEKPYKNYMLYIALGALVLSLVLSDTLNRDATRPGGYFGLSVLNLNYNNIYIYIPVALAILVSLTLTCALLPRSNVAFVMSRGSFFIMAVHYYFLISPYYTTPSWKEGKWEASMHIGLRTGVYITVILVSLLLLLDVIRKRVKIVDKALFYLGI